MKKNIKNIALSVLALSGLMFVSCDQDESLNRTGKPTITLAESSTTVSEGQNPSITFNFDYQIPFASEMRVEIIGGTATLGVDYTIPNYDTLADYGGNFYGGAGYYASIGAYTTTYTMNDFIVPTIDSDVEGTETVILRFHEAVTGQAKIYQDFTVNIVDIVPSALDMVLDFDGDITVDGTTYDKCMLDFDFYISSSATANDDVAHNWNGPCNEAFSLNNNPAVWGLNNQVYYVWVDFWARSAEDYLPGPFVPEAGAITTHEDITMNLDFSKVVDGNTVFSETLNLDGLFTTASISASSNGSDADQNPNSGKPAAKIVIAGNDYIITDMSNNIVAQGRMANTVHPRAKK